jgi:hypothetical protein
VPNVGRLPPHIGFDGVKCRDTFEQIADQRGRLGLVDIEDLAPEVGPAGDLAAAVELVVAGVGVSLQEPGIAGQMLLGMSAGPVGRELVSDQR